ncbi:uncharacterized protein N7477_008895 [Penicillium maclennaniae]|uniref:uncharacterized protein n=1 Tax=Penicillium maclennaniae TaxID=1343394 RepID=UPI00254122BD|nr:uncharacterized protein N7477_008895 [Penicillium maclennaniae]KAJ5666447.1 hypothetical protein N7477_008895 [Penicillium maclennaniae]
MPKKKWKEELRKFLRGEPADPTDQDDQKFYSLCQKAVNEQKSIFAALPISSLNLEEVQVMLGLELTLEDPELAAVTTVAMSSELTNVLKKIEMATLRGQPNEAIIRITVDMLIIYALDAARSRNSTGARSLPTGGETMGLRSSKTRKKASQTSGEAGLRSLRREESTEQLGYHSVWHIWESYIGYGKRLAKRTALSMAWFPMTDTSAFLKSMTTLRWSERYLRTRVRDYSEIMGLLVHFFQKAAMMSPTHSKESSRQTHIKENSGSTVYSSADGDSLMGDA